MNLVDRDNLYGASCSRLRVDAGLHHAKAAITNQIAEFILPEDSRHENKVVGEEWQIRKESVALQHLGALPKRTPA